MPAYFDTGFSVRMPMWHGEGTVLDDYPTDWADARVKAGLMWEPKALPAYTFDPTRLKCCECSAALNDPHDPTCPSQAGEDTLTLVRPTNIDSQELIGGIIESDDDLMVVRDDTMQRIGMVSDQFSLITHDMMGGILEAILAEPNVKFETAGSCKGGAQVWALAYLDEPFTLAGDDSESYPFVALLNSHDGNGACKVTRTSVRVVCWNTYNAASLQGQRTGLEFTFRHVGDVDERIEQAKAALQGAREDAQLWSELAKDLYETPVSDEMVERFVLDFVPEPAAEIVSDRVRNNVDRARKTFRKLYHDSVTCAAHKGTALGLLDASVEYLDHARKHRSPDTLMNRTLLRPEPLKARALAMIREHVS